MNLKLEGLFFIVFCFEYLGLKYLFELNASAIICGRNVNKNVDWSSSSGTHNINDALEASIPNKFDVLYTYQCTVGLKKYLSRARSPFSRQLYSLNKFSDFFFLMFM